MGCQGCFCNLSLKEENASFSRPVGHVGRKLLNLGGGFGGLSVSKVNKKSPVSPADH